MKSNKKNDKKESATQQLLNLKQFVPLQIGDNGAVAIEGEDGMLYTYIMLRPDNISVLGRSEVLAKIRNLQNILSDVAELQMLCMSSAQNYEDNKRYYRHLAETTESPMVKQLCLQEIAYLDEINIAMSTSREFAMILRHRADRLDDARRSIMQILNLIREHQFHARIATKDSFKRLLAIYYVGDIYTEHVPDFDGMQYMEVNNVETAETLYRKCLNANDYLTAESSYAIAQMQNNEQLPLTDMQKLYKTAAEIWLKDDHPENHIHLRLARMYEYGLGVPEDLSLAIDHYKAALKTPETEYKLGQLMQRIDGDATEIYAHYAAARVGMLYAEEHSPTSATAQQAVRLATMYRYGLGCDADHETAVHWYTVAAERGSIYAQQRLEVMEMQRIRQEQRAAEYAEKQQQQQNLSFAARLLNTIGNALCRQTLRDQQSATATTDRKQRRMQRRLKRALGQKEDYEQIFQ